MSNIIFFLRRIAVKLNSFDEQKQFSLLADCEAMIDLEITRAQYEPERQKTKLHLVE
jgi:hypothetical protein